MGFVRSTTASTLLLACAAGLLPRAAAGASLVQSQSFTVLDTGGQVLSFSAFDPSLGRLHGVSLTVNSSYSGEIQAPLAGSGTLELGVSAPRIDLSRTDTAACSGPFSCDGEPLSGAFDGDGSFSNPFAGSGDLDVVLGATTEGDMSGSWSGSVGLAYHYLPVAGGPTQVASASTPVSLPLQGSSSQRAFGLPRFDPSLGNLRTVVLDTSTSYSGSVETAYGQDPDIDLAIAALLLERTGVENTGGVCSSPFGGCDDSFSGTLSGSTSFTDPYLTGAPIDVSLGSSATQDYAGSWSGTVSLAYDYTPTPVPEPGTALLVAAGLAGLGAWRRARATPPVPSPPGEGR